MTSRDEPQAAGDDPQAAKAALRSRLLAARAALSADVRAAASATIRAQLERLPELAGARAVLGYAAFGAEVDLDPFLAGLANAGVGVFLPWVDGPELGIARVRDLEADVAPGWRGVREPRDRRAARPDRLDAVIVPGVGFDRRGARLGYGGGHFDRLIARVRAGGPAAVVAVAFDVQVVDLVPVGAHDQLVDVLVTESGTLRAGRSGAAGAFGPKN